MKKTISILLLIIISAGAVVPCGPGFITPIFEYKHAPENPYENFAAGRIGILKPSYRRVVLFAAYRYLNNGSFSAEEQKGLVDVWNAEFKNQSFETDDVAEAVKAWVEKRKDVAGSAEKIPDIYTERESGGYDFFPNCTKSAFETAIQTLSDRVSSHGSDNKDVKAWVAAQDKVFTNCATGKQTPEPPDETMPEWLHKDRAYQIAAAEFYSLDYEKAKNRFRAVAEDAASPWQETADYMVGRTLIRQASLSKDPAAETRFYTEAEQHLQTTAARSSKFQESANRLLGLIKYRLHPQERVGELARSLSASGSPNFRQELIDYTWLLDKFEKESLEAEEKRKEAELKKNSDQVFGNSTPPPGDSRDPISPPGWANPNSNTNVKTVSDEGKLEISVYKDDYSKSWTVYIDPEATDAEALAEAERVAGPLTPLMKERFLDSKKIVYSVRFTNGTKPDYQGGYFGTEKPSLSVLPEFLRQDDLTDWLYTFQIQNAEAYLYSLANFKRTNSDLWLLTALSKADKNSSELNYLLKAAESVNFSAPAFPTVAYHKSRILLEQNKMPEAKKLLDEVLDSPTELPVSSRNQFLALRMKTSETLDDFLRHAQRKAFAFDMEGESGTVEYFIEREKSWYNPAYNGESKADFDRIIEEGYKEERLWQEREMFDDKTIEAINEHFPLTVMIEAEKSEALPDYLKKRLALAVWTRAAILEDFTTAALIAPQVVKFMPETEELMKQFLAAKTLPAKRYASLYLLLKIKNLTPYVSSGMGTPAESYKTYATEWWCQPYYSQYDEETGEEVPYKPSPRPLFLTKAQSDAAQGEIKKLRQIGDAPKFFGAKVLEWARLAPTDKRVPESLLIVYESNGWDKYGCGNNMELRQEIADLLKKRYPTSEEAKQVIEEEKQAQ